MLSRQLLVGGLAFWLVAMGPAAAGHHSRSGHTTLTESACTFTAEAQWAGHANTAQVKFRLGANFGDGPVTVGFVDTTPTFDASGNGHATATWLLAPASDVGFFSTEAWLLDSDGTLLEVLRQKSAKPLRAACA